MQLYMSLMQAGVMKWTPKVRSVRRLNFSSSLFHHWICIKNHRRRA